MSYTSSYDQMPVEQRYECLQVPGSSDSQAGPWCGRHGKQWATASAAKRRQCQVRSKCMVVQTSNSQLSRQFSSRRRRLSVLPCELLRTPRSYSSLQRNATHQPLIVPHRHHSN